MIIAMITSIIVHKRPRTIASSFSHYAIDIIFATSTTIILLGFFILHQPLILQWYQFSILSRTMSSRGHLLRCTDWEMTVLRYYCFPEMLLSGSYAMSPYTDREDGYHAPFFKPLFHFCLPQIAFQKTSGWMKPLAIIERPQRPFWLSEAYSTILQLTNKWN